MKISIKNSTGKAAGDLEVKFPLVEGGRGTQAVHDTVTAYRAGQRSGTATHGRLLSRTHSVLRPVGTGAPVRGH